jgi:hypothetical protein
MKLEAAYSALPSIDEVTTNFKFPQNRQIFALTCFFLSAPVGILMSAAKNPSPFMSFTHPSKPFMAYVI